MMMAVGNEARVKFDRVVALHVRPPTPGAHLVDLVLLRHIVPLFLTPTMNSLYTSGVRQTSSIQADLERLKGGDTSAALLGACIFIVSPAWRARGGQHILSITTLDANFAVHPSPFLTPLNFMVISRSHRPVRADIRVPRRDATHG